jgi:hypothetical protein
MVFLGTASDRYAGWIGQIYPEESYAGKIARRSKAVGNQTVTEEVLPVESVTEYFRHFAVLELDFTFYSLLLDKDLKPTQTYHVLETYRKYLRQDDRLILKVPQVLFAKKLWRSGRFSENQGYLDAETFMSRRGTCWATRSRPSCSNRNIRQRRTGKRRSNSQNPWMPFSRRSHTMRGITSRCGPSRFFPNPISRSSRSTAWARFCHTGHGFPL